MPKTITDAEGNEHEVYTSEEVASLKEQLEAADQGSEGFRSLRGAINRKDEALKAKEQAIHELQEKLKAAAPAGKEQDPEKGDEKTKEPETNTFDEAKYRD